MTRLLVCAALAAETQAFPPDGQWGLQAVDVRVVVTGPGKVNAASRLAGFLFDHPEWKPDLVLNVGTAGALGGLGRGTYEIGVVEQHDFDVETLRRLTDEEFGQGPRQLVLVGHGSCAERRGGTPWRGHVLLSGDRVIAEANERDRLGAAADLVDMEAYGLAALCERAGLAMAATKYVSDTADESVFETWRDVVAHASASLFEWIERHADAVRARCWAYAAT